MKIAYFDCHSGISGDMVLGALVDLGVPLKTIETELKGIPLKGYRITARKVKRGLFGGTHVRVSDGSRGKKGRDHLHPHRTFSDIRKLLKLSKLAAATREHALAVFEAIARAEAKVHRTSMDKIHFHEVGAVDSIIDIVGGVAALQHLEAGRVYASPLNTGQGTVACDHGVLPVPAPATLELLRGVPCYSSGVATELTTPTGAALIRHFAHQFGSLPPMAVEAIGYGAGSKIIPELPNFLRVIVGEMPGEAAHRVSILETNIDDMNPEFFDHVMDQLFALGALDVYFTAIGMKKNRPSIKLTVLAPPEKREALSRLLLTETSTFGLRGWEADRMVLERELIPVKTPFGKVKVKVGRLGGIPVHYSPEYDDCKKIAKRKNRPIQEVYDIIRQCAREQLGENR